MKRFLLVPMVGIIAALGIGSAAALTFAPAAQANVAAGTETVGSCGDVSDVAYATGFVAGEYKVTGVTVTVTGTACSTVAITLSEAAAANPYSSLPADVTVLAGGGPETATWTLPVAYPIDTLLQVHIAVQ